MVGIDVIPELREGSLHVEVGARHVAQAAGIYLEYIVVNSAYYDRPREYCHPDAQFLATE